MSSGNATIAKWVGDGSEGGKLDVLPVPVEASAAAAHSTIAFASATQGTPFNIRIDDDADGNAADSYYEVKVTELSKGASLAVGFVAVDGFRPGWRTKGYFYNGNVTNGSAGLIIGFGDRIKEGDVVGAYQRRSVGGGVDGGVDGGRRCDVVFYHNGRCLGAGFSVDEEDERLLPCLHLSGSATVAFSTPPPPTVFEREQTVYGEGDRYSGDWSIERAFVGPELGELPIPEGSNFQVSFQKADAPETPYLLSVKISNSFRTSFAMAGKMEAFDEIEFTSHCMATKMMPRPAAQKMENLVRSALDKDGGFKKMIISDQGQLIMSGPTAEIICSRYTETFEPMRSA